jgi:hypothetical protein
VSELVKRAAVARFLGQDAEEVQMAIDLDGMPHTKVPGRKRPGVRIFLPDLHEWLRKRSQVSPKLADYGEFRRAFMAAQERPEPVETSTWEAR